jgi:Domain of unknown function (DUF4157)
MQRAMKTGTKTDRQAASPGPKTGPLLTGRPLPSGLRSDMERAFGQDFSTVRVHEDHAARGYRALAFARGEGLHFKPGLFQPKAEDGRRMIAHELAHVIQQRASRVTTGTGPGGEVNSDRGLESEAYRADDLVASGQSVRGLFKGGQSHASGCGCGTCAARATVAAPAGAARTAPAPSVKLVGGPCATCGGDHDTQYHGAIMGKHEAKSRKKKIDDAAYKEKLSTFKAQKSEAIARKQEEEKEPVAKNAKGLLCKKQQRKAEKSKFSQKHTTERVSSLGQKAKEVGAMRTFGGSSQSGLSTVVDMSSEDRQREERFQLEVLKYSEAEIDETGKLTPKFGVNKPTQGDYPMVTSEITTGPDGKRKVKMGQPKMAKPIVGMKGDKFVHLEGVQEDDA